MMDIGEVRQRASGFADTLREAKAALRPDEFWYPYDSLWNIVRLEEVLPDPYKDFDVLVDGKPIADIGAGDGDCAFFLESLGHDVHLVDRAATNFNRLEGARLLKERLSSSVEIVDGDLDARVPFPARKYGLAFFLGVLYHLKNPYRALEGLSYKAKYCFLSTRIARLAPGGQPEIGEIPVAYLLEECEIGGDPTNYWIFSPVGLRRIIGRTGWRIRAEMTGGPTESEPVRLDRDERLFAFLESTRLRHWT
jgi:hypothetical protein